MNTYRVGLIGMGNIARAHAAGYQDVKNAEIKLVAGSDINPDSDHARDIVDKFGIRMYKNYHTMLANESLDIVSICVWPSKHWTATIAAAQYGVKAILCEKPMALSLAEADSMIEVCENNDVILAIGHAHRFSAQTVKAKEWIKSGEIGDISMIWGHCSLDLMNNGTHVIDLINYLNNDTAPSWVMGQIDRRTKSSGRRNHPDIVFEDMAIGRVGYENGVVGVVELGERANQNFAFRVIGSDGIIEINRVGGPLLRLLSGSSNSNWQIPKLHQGHSNIHLEIEELIAAMEGLIIHRSHAKIARVTLEIIVGIFESSARRCAMEFPIKISEVFLKTRKTK